MDKGGLLSAIASAPSGPLSEGCLLTEDQSTAAGLVRVELGLFEAEGRTDDVTGDHPLLCDSTVVWRGIGNGDFSAEPGTRSHPATLSASRIGARCLAPGPQK